MKIITSYCPAVQTEAPLPLHILQAVNFSIKKKRGKKKKARSRDLLPPVNSPAGLLTLWLRSPFVTVLGVKSAARGNVPQHFVKKRPEMSFIVPSSEEVMFSPPYVCRSAGLLKNYSVRFGAA